MMATEEKLITLKKAAGQLGISRPALHKLLSRHKINKVTFEMDREAYILLADFERIRTLREQAAARKEASNN